MPPLKVLIVEDDENDVFLLEKELRQGGFELSTRVATHQAAFVAALETFHPDLIVSDFKLPRFDALSALELAQARSRKTPFIVFTGAVEEETAVLCMKLGAWDYVMKQHPARLVDCVRRALERRRLVDEREQALREADQRFRQIADAIPALLWLCDAAGRFHFCNRAWRDFTGLAGPGDDWLGLVHDEDRAEFQRLFREKLEHRLACATEFRLRRADGESRWIFCTAAPHVSPEGDFLGLVGIGFDTTERKLATTPPGIRHELNNQLAVIRMYSEVLAEGRDTTDSQRAKLREIITASERSAEIVKRLPSTTAVEAAHR